MKNPPSSPLLDLSVDLFQCDCECGCAAKIPADRLRTILSGLDLPRNPRLLVGPETLDDAGIYELAEDLLLVQTVDFFPPVARDPYTYGRIAAANALSDVYAMGGTPLTAMAIVCFPAARLAPELLKDITRGAVDTLREAGVVLMGGHSVVDPQPKYGLAVTGTVKRNELMDNAHATPGDVLILTKPLGTGVTLTAIKGGLATPAEESAVNHVMSTLNRKAAELAHRHGARSCTDITGFGLLGHAVQMAEASGVAMELRMEAMPLPARALEFAEMGLLPAATYSNRAYVGNRVAFDEDVSLGQQDLLFDPQTSGGLFVACPADRADAFLADCARELDAAHSVIGSVLQSRPTTPAGGAPAPYITIHSRTTQ